MISLCVLTKNSEKIIEKCIGSAAAIADEIIVVDTGSNDETKKIAEKLGAMVYDYKWDDNFSNAKNFLKSKATKEWILILDHDETISSLDFDKIKELIKSDIYLGYYLIQRNYVNSIGNVGFVSCKDDIYEESKLAFGYVPRKMVRLFKNDSCIKFLGSVHEQVIQSIEEVGLGLIGDSDIAIHHYGLFDREKERNRKYIEIEKRNLRNDFYQEYQIAIQLHSIGEIKEAIEHLMKSISLNQNFNLSFLELGMILMKLGKISEAKPLLLHSVMLKENETALNNLGIVEVYEKNFGKAIEYFKKAISLNGKNADYYFNLAQVLKQGGRNDEAKREFERAVYYNSSYEGKRGEFEK
ncbi:tetratricopeptide repeat protein [Candidatus Pacearchaeota archaeon]|nr:tetratricopeptide repeat protein [Candidatus Pacearchaeota archaeon]